MRRSVLAPSALALLVTASLACSSELPSEDSGEAEEHVTELKSYWADAKKLDLGDLTRVTMGFASDALNDGLAVGSFAARVETPQVFGVAAEPNKVLPAQAQVKGLETVVTGLGARFGFGACLLIRRGGGALVEHVLLLDAGFLSARRTAAGQH